MAGSTKTAAATVNVDHLVVLVHGLWGNPTHLSFLQKTLLKQYPNDGLEILLPSSNRDYNTYDGLDVGGERIAHEIEGRLRELKEAGNTIKKISITGYSLGGVIARYAIGLLYKAGVFDEVQPINFTTFATPHLGVRTPTQSYKAQTWNFLGSRTLSTSGQQIFLVDDFRESGRGLLEIMADPNSIFIKGLSMFKSRSVYANTINDRSVPYYTAAMSRVDEFVNLDKITPHYLDQESNEKVILDPEDPVSPRKPSEQLPTSGWQSWALSESTRRVIPFYVLFVSIVPIAIPLFLINAGYQTYRSAQRIRLHEQNGTIDLKRYRVPFLEEAQALQDGMVERLTTERARRAEQYLPKSKSNDDAARSTKADDESDLDEIENSKNKSAFPTLALTRAQFKMIDGLERVGFVKYRAHIVKARHTHAAIVVRMNRSSFEEGRVVVRHWARQFTV